MLEVPVPTEQDIASITGAAAGAAAGEPAVPMAQVEEEEEEVVIEVPHWVPIPHRFRQALVTQARREQKQFDDRVAARLPPPPPLHHSLYFKIACSE